MAQRNNVHRTVEKPCPFCKGRALRVIDLDDRSDEVFKLYHCSITCTQCGATIAHDFVPPAWLKWPDQAASRFITKAWNRRDGVDKPPRKGNRKPPAKKD